MKINNYINYIVTKGINIQKNDVVEIITSCYLKKYNKMLEEACLNYGASLVFIKYTDGRELEDEISLNCKLYIDNEEKKYKKLINNKFVRIKINSPFLPKMVIDNNNILIYKENINKLKFVEDYFYNFNSRFTICSFPNPYWASKLKISEEILLDRIIELSLKKNNYLDKLNSLKLNKLKFIDDNTNIEFELTNNFLFQGRNQKSNNIEFEPNIPCKEIYTAPNKFKVNGYVFSNRTMNYNGNLINNIYIKFENGKIVDSNIKNMLNEDEMLYCGEIALAEYENNYFYNTILDENCSCHLALGNAYKYGISELDKINRANHHFDICFGSSNMIVLGKSLDKEYSIIKNNKFVIEEL